MRATVFAVLLLLSCCLSSTATRETIARTITSNVQEQAYLNSIKVIYVDGMPTCGGLSDPESVILGCFYPSGGYIEIATNDFRYHDARAFRYESQMEETLEHEMIHALQWYRCSTTWHPVNRNFTCPNQD